MSTEINDDIHIVQLPPKVSNKRKSIGGSSSDSSDSSPNSKRRLHDGIDQNTKNDPKNMFMGYNGAVVGNHSLGTEDGSASSEDNNSQPLWWQVT